MTHETQGRRTARAQFGLFGVGVFMVVALAACSSTNNGTGNAANSVAGPVVSTLENATFGTILVSGGRTLYTLAPSGTACDSACTNIWPELSLPSGVTGASAGSGVSASNLGTVSRGGQTRQVTYGGKALYFFSGDSATGQVNGNITDTWGKWSVAVTAGPAGSVGPTTTAPHVTTTTAPAGGGGVGF